MRNEIKTINIQTQRSLLSPTGISNGQTLALSYIILNAFNISFQKPKCEQYWPNVGTTTVYGDVKVTSLSDNQYADFTIRALTLEKVCSLISFSTQKHNPQAQKSKVRRQKVGEK